MRRYLLVTCILSITLAVFSLNSFGQAIVDIYEGPIEGLVFAFETPLPVTVPGVGTLNVAYAEVEAPGREHIVLTQSGQYNYHADLDAGTIYAWENVNPQGMPIGQPTPVPMLSATVDEHFTIEGPVPDSLDDVVVPDDVDVYFKAVLPTPEGPFRLQLKIKAGELHTLKPS
jgi:hypothetical protein